MYVENQTNNAVNTAADYKVGPYNPPLHTRWRKGQSGNPSGRPRRSLQDLKDLFRKLFSRPTKVLTPDGEQTVTLIEALVLSAANIALKKGNIRLIEMLFDFYEKITAADARLGAHTGETDQAVLGDLARRLIQDLALGAQATEQAA
jgi:Family of unknown function (DUF5681)